MARHYMEYLFERTHDLLLARAGGRELDKTSTEQIRAMWRKVWADAKDNQPYWSQITTNLTGVASQTVIGRTPTIDQPVVYAGMSSNAPATGQLISLENETNKLQYQMQPTPPTGIFADVQRTTERFFRPFPQTYVGANNRLKLTSLNSATAPVTQLITYAFMGNTVVPPSADRKQYDAELDAEFERRIGQMLAGDPDQMIPPQELILQMDVTFDGTASQIVQNRRTDKFSRPVLILGGQHNFAAKDTIAIGGPTALLTSMDTRTNWSVEQLPLWFYADYVTEPEQWIMYPRPILLRPNTQVQGTFVNGTTGAVGAGTYQLFFYCIQF